MGLSALLRGNMREMFSVLYVRLWGEGGRLQTRRRALTENLTTLTSDLTAFRTVRN